MYNRVILVGNLGKDPEVRHTATGEPIVILNLATSESWRDKKTNEKKEATEWHKVVSYGPMGEGFASIARKGDSVMVEGKIRTRSYEKDGSKHYATEVIANLLRKVGKKEADGYGRASEDEVAMHKSASKADPFDDEMPDF